MLSKSQIKFVRSLQIRKFRDESGCFVAEGDKCVNELLGHFPLELLVRPDEVSGKELEQLSALRTPQGSIAVFHKREESLPSSDILCKDITLVLDGVQDPGNLGTIIRTADWFGVRNIICSKDTVDCYNPKVVQATMGALARVHIFYADLEVFVSEYRKAVSAPVYGTLLNGRNMYADGALSGNGLLIMGSEGSGISAALRDMVTHPLLIPSYPANTPTVESLNVAIATSVVLAEMRRSQG